MSTYTDRAMELAEDMADKQATKVLCGGRFFHEKKIDATKALRQYLEAGEPDCRTCKNFNGYKQCWHNSQHMVQCINFSKYKRADYTPLCEVTIEKAQ